MRRRRLVPRIAASASAASSDSIPGRRCCRAPTTTTCRSSRRRTRRALERDGPQRAHHSAGRPPASAGSVRQWVGDSRGRWEGDTLVVETTNFHGETAFPNSGPNLRLTDASRAPDADTLLYEFTVDDPSTWTKPWTVQVPMTQVDRADVRVRLPRGQLRHDESAQRGPSGREGRRLQPRSKCDGNSPGQAESRNLRQIRLRIVRVVAVPKAMLQHGSRVRLLTSAATVWCPRES